MLQRIQLPPSGAESRSSFELKREEMDCGGECNAMDQSWGITMLGLKQGQ
jgi:hypothetical protein